MWLFYPIWYIFNVKRRVSMFSGLFFKTTVWWGLKMHCSGTKICQFCLYGQHLCV